MFSALVIFSINSASYLSEVFRSGIESVDRGQIEAARALGVNAKQINLHIVIPQALRNILPALFNEFIALTKETSVVQIIGLSDLMRQQSIISANTFRYFEPLIIVGIIYYLLNIILSHLGQFIERKLKYD